jgi:flagellar hook-length control protein FliK
MPAQVEIAALNTRPYTQAIDAEATDEQAEIMPATSAVTTGRMTDPASTVPATSSGSLQSAVRNSVRNAVEANPDDNAAEVAADDAEIVPATSAATLSAERLTELRQIQAYAENMAARTNDGSNSSSSNPSIDLAAMSARLDKSNGPMAAGQPTLHTAPQSLNFTEKGWENAFGQNIQWMSANNIKSAQIRINPAELGPVQIDLTMNKDHLTLQINASHQITRDTLEAALPRLRSELADQGFTNANIDMTDQGKGQQSGQQTGEQESPFADDVVRSLEENGDAAEIVPATSAINLMSGSVSLLDTFA